MISGHGEYHNRLSVANKVGDLKGKLSKTQLAFNMKRSKVTAFIASHNSSQKFEPLIGKFIDRAYVNCPLSTKAEDYRSEWRFQQ